MHIRPKDYIYTDEGLYFAVVSDHVENNRLLAFLRYRETSSGLEKVETSEAVTYIRQHHPEFHYHSEYADVDLHGIPVECISNIYRPEDTVAHLFSMTKFDSKQQDALYMINLLVDAGIKQSCLGITGSLMLGTHSQQSDIDIVVYGRENFFAVREVVKQRMISGVLGTLEKEQWEDAYQRRQCELDFEEYCQYEMKKYNKCLSGSSKVDISMVPLDDEKLKEFGPYKKHGKEKIISRVADAAYAYDFPARYYVDDKRIDEVVTYTATYVGQADVNDCIEAVGYIEEDCRGKRRLVVGTSREAVGEYIKVI